MSLTLYGEIRSAYVARVAIILTAKGIRYEAALPPPDFAKFAPLQKVPVLRLEDGRCLSESAVIMEYLEDAYPDVPVLPASAFDRARARLIGHLADHYIETPLLSICRQYYTDARDSVANAWNTSELTRLLNVIDGSVDRGSYLVGDHLTLADAALAPFMYYIVTVMPVVLLTDPLERLPGLQRWWQAMRDHHIAGGVLQKLHDSFSAIDRLKYGKRFK